MYFLVWMTPSNSPYAVFRAEEWVSVAQPIGIGQCLRLKPKRISPMKSSTQRKSGISLKKAISKQHVQLSFAWYIYISNIVSILIAELSYLAIYGIVLFFLGLFDLSSQSLDTRRESDFLVSRGKLTIWLWMIWLLG